jgi:hypothetical protein
MSINSPSLSSDPPSDLVVQFLADLMRATIDHHDQAAFQRALQSYCDNLHPWLEPSDGPPNPRTIFSLLESCAFDESGEHITVVLAPEAEALFRAWLRRNQIASVAGLNTAPAWSN